MVITDNDWFLLFIIDFINDYWWCLLMIIDNDWFLLMIVSVVWVISGSGQF